MPGREAKMVPSELTAQLGTQMMDSSDVIIWKCVQGAVRSQRRDPKVKLGERTVGNKEHVQNGRKGFRERGMGAVWKVESWMSMNYSQGRKYRNQRLLGERARQRTAICLPQSRPDGKTEVPVPQLCTETELWDRVRDLRC